ncbi:MAG: hypothetical protein CMP60_07190 [Flavobacteriales bacterium]|nr:hypothetical protein [Flavobacteriales bacterium]
MRYVYIVTTLIFTFIYSHSTDYSYDFIEASNYRTLGDINEDGAINIQDVVLLINLILSNEHNDLADLNNDNISNVLDVVQIINVILYGQEYQECLELDYSTEGILTNLSEQIFNDDESVNTFSIYSWTSDESDRILSGNGIPNHEVGTFPNPNCPSAISEQSINHTFSLFPEIVSDNGQAIGGPGGVIAYALNSVKFDPGTAGRCDDDGVCSLAQGQGQWNIEALGHETFDFGDDMNHAHVQPTGQYHYHGIPDLLIDFLNQGEDMTLVGWASDGFPVYAQYGYSEACDASSEIISLQPSWKLKDEPDAGRPEFLTQLSGGPGGGQTNLDIPISMGAFTQDFEYIQNYGDLDECNGRVGVTPEFPDGIYYYMVTNEFPFFSRCLKGDFSSNNNGGTGGGTGGGGNIPSCDNVPQGMPCCGDGICGGPENSNNCPIDCN